MKKSPATFLQIVIVLLGLGVITALLWEPQLEGVNAHATIFEIYFKDPFLAYVYIFSIPFFIALFQTYKVLGYAAQNKALSPAAVKSLQTIKYCAILTAGAIVAADVFIGITARNTNDDSAGAIMLGIIATFVSIVIAAAAGMFQRTLQKAVDIKSENDLTV